jgi:hypothetical protein
MNHETKEIWASEELFLFDLSQFFKRRHNLVGIFLINTTFILFAYNLGMTISDTIFFFLSSLIPYPIHWVSTHVKLNYDIIKLNNNFLNKWWEQSAKGIGCKIFALSYISFIIGFNGNFANLREFLFSLIIPFSLLLIIGTFLEMKSYSSLALYFDKYLEKNHYSNNRIRRDFNDIKISRWLLLIPIINIFGFIVYILCLNSIGKAIEKFALHTHDANIKNNQKLCEKSLRYLEKNKKLTPNYQFQSNSQIRTPAMEDLNNDLNQEEILYCVNCGMKLNTSHDAFCWSCGLNLNSLRLIL